MQSSGYRNYSRLVCHRTWESSIFPAYEVQLPLDHLWGPAVWIVIFFFFFLDCDLKGEEEVDTGLCCMF